MAQELARRDVDGGEDRRIDVERALPGGEFERRALHGEDAEIDDEAVLLGDRDEGRGRDRAELGVVPAQQRLEARDGPVLQPHDRLERDPHLAAIERAAEVALQHQAIAALVAHGGAEDLRPVAAQALGLDHRDLGVLEHLLALQVAARFVEGDADGDGEEDSRSA